MNSDINIAQLDRAITDAWSLIADTRVHEAKAVIEEMMRVIQVYKEKSEEHEPFQEIFAHVYHVAGYTASMSVRNSEAFAYIQYFREMKHIARNLKNDTLFIIALSYEGDAYRRLGKLQKALNCLQNAYNHTPQPDDAARGNCAQLLGRVYFRLDDFNNFEKLMGEAEKIAHTIDPVMNSLHGQYCLGTVYIDYARSYSQIGQIQKSLDYLQQAELVMPSSPHWKTLLTATRGILLVKSGDIKKGMPYVVEAVRLGYEHGNQRLFDHFYALQRYLDEKNRDINEAGIMLGEALDRSLDF